MAELADAQRSGRCLIFQVQVRILLGAYYLLYTKINIFKHKKSDLLTLNKSLFFIYILYFFKYFPVIDFSSNVDCSGMP